MSTRDDLLSGLEEEALRVAPVVILEVGFLDPRTLPVMPVAGDLAVSRRVEPAGVVGYWAVEPCFDMVTTEELRLMRARYLLMKGRLYDHWEDVDPTLREALDRDFFDSQGPGPRILPRGVHSASFPHQGSIVTCPKCGVEEDVRAPGGPTKLARFVAVHSRCGTDAPPLVLPDDFKMRLVAVNEEPPPPPPQWTIYAYDGRSSRGERAKFVGGLAEAHATWRKLKAPKTGYARVVGPDGEEIDVRRASTRT